MSYLDKALKSINSQTEMEKILGTPIRALKKPLAIHSQILDEVIYLVANEEMARSIEAQGKITYTPEEIAALSRASKDKDREEWVGFLKKLHIVKKTFTRSRIQA